MFRTIGRIGDMTIFQAWKPDYVFESYVEKSLSSECVDKPQHLTQGQGPVLLTFLRHVARISANGIVAFKESCAPIG